MNNGQSADNITEPRALLFHHFGLSKTHGSMLLRVYGRCLNLAPFHLHAADAAASGQTDSLLALHILNHLTLNCIYALHLHVGMNRLSRHGM